MLVQNSLDDFKDAEDDAIGVPSAHDTGKMFFPRVKDGKWICDSIDGPCEHYKRYKTPCRHILLKKYKNIQNLWTRIVEITRDKRDFRDIDCMSFDEVITVVSFFRSFEVNRLCSLLLNIAILKGVVTSDDLHEATNEMYCNDKIVGVVVGSCLRGGLIEYVDRKKTSRKIAHGRSIGIYQITEKGFKSMERKAK